MITGNRDIGGLRSPRSEGLGRKPRKHRPRLSGAAPKAYSDARNQGSSGECRFIRPNGQKNVTDWNIGGTWKIPKWFDLDLRYYGCDARFAGNLADNRLIVKITRSF